MQAKNDFKISLIIPAHNEEKYIADCLEHVIKNSNGKFFEIIVVNNVSSDKTEEIALKFPGVRVVHEHNKGLTHARQRGYIEAKGDILAYIDADTRMPKKTLRRGLLLGRPRSRRDQPPLLGRLPGFFLLRVETPRSRLMRWPRPPVGRVKPGMVAGRGVDLRSASVTILLPIWCSRRNK